jgi:nicotinamidase-related amidase
MPPSCEEGYRVTLLQKPLGQIGLVLVHCWNIGESTGPYPTGSQERYPGQVADWVPEAHAIIADRIAPVLEAARAAGMAVFHLAQPTYAPRYPQFRAIVADPQLQEPAEEEVAGCVRPRTFAEHFLGQYGEAFPGPVWETHAEIIDIATPVRPTGDEAVVVDGWQLNGLCRRKDIDTLIYAGFMADLCLMNVPGAIREMFTRFGYTCIALRDCTTAYEYSDTHQGGWMTRAAIRMLETDLGYTALSVDLTAALDNLRSGTAEGARRG